MNEKHEAGDLNAIDPTLQRADPRARAAAYKKPVQEKTELELAAEEAALDRAKRATSEYLDKLKASMAEYAETVSRVYDYVEPLPPQEEPAAAPEPAEEPPAPEEPPKEGVSQDTVENIAEIINRAFSSLEEKEKAAEEEAGTESTISKLPKIDYDNLQFGENYDPKNKK